MRGRHAPALKRKNLGCMLYPDALAERLRQSRRRTPGHPRVRGNNMKPFRKNAGRAFVTCARYAVATVCAVAANFGCGSPAADDSSLGSTSAALSTSGQRASGSGHIVMDDARRTFSFTALRHEDGTVSGEAELF